MRIRFTLLTLLLCGACKPEEASDKRPAEAPDIWVLAVSGHCLPIMGLCDGDWNPEYLSHAGTIEAVANPLFDQTGLDVRWTPFVDGWYSWVNLDDELLASGFVDLVANLEFAKREWMDGYKNPTRVVLVGHGHGVVWTHLAAHAAPDVPIEAMIDLDGQSSGWDDDVGYLGVGDAWPDEIPGFIDDSDRKWDIDDWHAEDNWAVTGLDPQDIEDVVPDNVALNLEVHSTPNYQQAGSDIFDADPNTRSDGSTEGIRLCTSQTDHYGVYEPGSDCLDWAVTELLGAL